MSTARRKPRDYRFFDKYSWYVPGVGGMFGMLAWLLVGALLGNVAAIICSIFLPTDYTLLIAYPIQFIPAMIYASTKSRALSMDHAGMKMDSNNFGSAGFVLCALVVIVATLSTAYCAEVPSMILPEMPEVIRMMLESMTQGTIWVNFLCVSIFAPFFEEWLCRGTILRGLLGNGMKPASAIAVSALFFAVIHMNPWQALPAFLLGALFGYVYYRTGSLKLTMLMHFTNNTFSLICSNVGSLKEAESWMDVLPMPLYWVVFAACLIAAVLSILFFSKIELKGKSGNCDPVPSLFES